MPGHEEPISQHTQPTSSMDMGMDDQGKPPSRGLGALKNLLGNNIKLPEFNTDTILLLVLVYFLVADSDDNSSISDTILIIAALFILGL